MKISQSDVQMYTATFSPDDQRDRDDLFAQIPSYGEGIGFEELRRERQIERALRMLDDMEMLTW